MILKAPNLKPNVFFAFAAWITLSCILGGGANENNKCNLLGLNVLTQTPSFTAAGTHCRPFGIPFWHIFDL